MVQAKELRLNNWIATGKQYSETSLIGKVLSIGNEEQEFEQIYCECEESFEWFFKDNYCGIPLTPDILERCGFKESVTKDWYSIRVNEESYLYNNPRDKFGLCIENKDAGTNTEVEELFIPLPHIQYLHQLQNLYFALTQTELTLTN